MIATCDKVLRARRYQGADDLTLDMRKRDRIEYTIVLDLPDGLHERALIAIVDAKEITVGELGELDI